jgi:hypothetical protein
MFAVCISKRVLSKVELNKFALSAKPKWLADIVNSSDDIMRSMLHLSRSDGGGWQIGEWLTLPSPYELVRL